MSCYPCSQGRQEDCTHLALCPDACCGPWEETDDEDQA